MICYPMKKKLETDQLNIRPLKTVIDRLGRLAQEFKGDVARKNEVAVEILEQYTDLWEAAEQFQKDVRQQQAEDLRKHGRVRAAVLPHGKANTSPEKKERKVR